MTDKEVLSLIKQRRSIRKFNDKDISDQDLLDLIEAGIYAPTGSNVQAWQFVIIKNKSDINFLGANKIPLVGTAKAIIFILTDLRKCHYLNGPRKHIFQYMSVQDSACATQNILLLATSKGIASCYIQFNKEWPTWKNVKDYFKFPDHLQPENLILLGYSDKKIDLETYKHQGRMVKRQPINQYILEWRK